MPHFAVVKNNVISNVVVADSATIVEMFVKNYDLIVKETEETGVAIIGNEFVNNKFVPLKPGKSWSFDHKAWQWNPPVPYPTDGDSYYWEDTNESWVKIES